MPDYKYYVVEWNITCGGDLVLSNQITISASSRADAVSKGAESIPALSMDINARACTEDEVREHFTHG
tara:strand:+ start:972 stop:1175 length:204 start_codon:yes stop_codon:yes gene_type:complete